MQRDSLVLRCCRSKFRKMNHYHAIIARSDGSKPNKRVTFEAETIEQAKELCIAKYGNTAVPKVWRDYFET